MYGTNKKAMENVSFVIPLWILKHWFIFVMNAIMDRLKDDVSFVVTQVLPMRTIVVNAYNKKRIEMDVLKLSI